MNIKQLISFYKFHKEKMRYFSKKYPGTVRRAMKNNDLFSGVWHSEGNSKPSKVTVGISNTPPQHCPLPDTFLPWGEWFRKLFKR